MCFYFFLQNMYYLRFWIMKSIETNTPFILRIFLESKHYENRKIL